MPSLCNLLVPPDSLGAHRSSYGECRRDRERAPSDPVKVVVTNRHTPDATMASNLSVVSLSYLRGSLQVGLAKLHHVSSVRGWLHSTAAGSCYCLPHREVEGMQRDAVDQVLQAVKFRDKNTLD